MMRPIISSRDVKEELEPLKVQNQTSRNNYLRMTKSNENKKVNNITVKEEIIEPPNNKFASYTTIQNYDVNY